VLGVNPVTAVESVVTVLSTTVVAKVETVESWTRYEVAPEDAAHERVGDTDTPVAFAAGELSAGAAGAGTLPVVKLRVTE
jgi:hypothetical protein